MSPVAISDFTGLVRAVQAASAFGNGVGYALGGSESWRTSSEAPFYENGEYSRLRMPLPGMVVHDVANGSWSNTTNASFTQSGSFSRGQLQHLPGYGAEGLLIPLGGSTSTAADDAAGRSLVNDFTTLSMYDVASGTWHTQKTSGEYPLGRINFCSVGVQGDDGTYEVTTAQEITDESKDANKLLDLHIWRWLSRPEERRRTRCSLCPYSPCFPLGEVELPTCPSSTLSHLQCSRSR